MPMKPRELIRLLEKNNFIQVSQNGSHVKMRNIENGKQVIVPFHNKELKKRKGVFDYETSKWKNY